MVNSRVLVVEDMLDCQMILKEILAGHYVTVAESVEEALFVLQEESFDLILMDINLPGKDGYSLLYEIQVSPDLNKIPIFCITGRNHVADKVSAFSLGADDYITKPFDFVELRARINAKLRKISSQRKHATVLTVGPIEIDNSRHRVTTGLGRDKKELSLPLIEYKILYHLAKRADQVQSREQLLMAVWGDDTHVTDRAVDVHIYQLRKKLGVNGCLLKTISRRGYKLSSKQPATVEQINLNRSLELA